MRLRQRGDEILGHGVTNSESRGTSSEAAERDLIQDVTSTIERHEGARPAGWMSPWLSNSAVTRRSAAGGRVPLRDGLDDGRPADLAHAPARAASSSMPYPIEVNDTRGVIWYHYRLGRVRRHDRRPVRRDARPVRAPAARLPDLAPPVRHGPPYRIRQLRRALQHIAGHRDRVWLTRPRDICAHIEGLPKGVVPSSDDAKSS